MRAGAAIACLVAVGALAALYFVFRPEPTAPPAPVVPAADSPARTEATPAETPAPPPAPTVFELVVAEGRRVQGPAVLRVSQGEEVALRITSDRDDELHVHGYDLHAHVHAAKPTELRFNADKSGRFEMELHESRLELGALEVQPR